LRIRGFITSRFAPPAPVLRAHFRNPHIGVQDYITFLLDTGASITTILDRDAIRLGLTLNYARRNLKPTPQRMVGIGGPAETYPLSSSELMFSLEEGGEHLERLNACLVLHDPERLGEEYNRVMLLPSILGRDIINKCAKLTYSQKRQIVLLEL